MKKNKRSIHPRTKAKLFLLALLVIPTVLLILPADYFDEGESICLSKVLANTECPGCGMTRGVQHLIHGEFQAAWGFNKLAFIVLPLLIGMVVWEIYRGFKHQDEVTEA